MTDEAEPDAKGVACSGSASREPIPGVAGRLARRCDGERVTRTRPLRASVAISCLPQRSMPNQSCVASALGVGVGRWRWAYTPERLRVDNCVQDAFDFEDLEKRE